MGFIRSCHGGRPVQKHGIGRGGGVEKLNEWLPDEVSTLHAAVRAVEGENKVSVARVSASGQHSLA